MDRQEVEACYEELKKKDSKQLFQGYINLLNEIPMQFAKPDDTLQKHS